MTKFARTNLHATALIVGEYGILIRGASGTGKSMLAFHLIADAVARGDFAALVADDQVFVEACNSRLAVRAPQATRALAEMRGIGILNVPFLESAIADCVVDLVEAKTIVRLPETEAVRLEGVDLPLARVPQRDTAAAILMIGQFLGRLSRGKTV